MYKTLKVRNVCFGKPGIQVPICVSVMAEDRAQLLAEMQRVIALQPDMIEWRLDFWKEAQLPIARLAEEIRKIIKETVLLATYRTQYEGGVGEAGEPEYRKLVIDALQCRDIDLVDIEAGREEGRLLREAVQMQERPYIIASFHDFHRTPEDGQMEAILLGMKEAGADICKMAVMPEKEEDVDRVMELTDRLHRQFGEEMLLMTISMGTLGNRTRIIGGSVGSCFTFAAAVEGGSAPGQIPIEALRIRQKQAAGA